MIKKLLNSLFGKEEKKVIATAVPIENEAPKKKKSGGYREEIKEKYGFDLPASDTDKLSLGKKYEKEDDLERACACYEGCVKNRFDGNAPYDRLIITYKKLDRPDDVTRIIKRAIAVFEKVTKQGRSDGPKKLEKYKAQLEKLA